MPFLVTFAIFFITSLLFVYFGKLWTDEYWYYSGSVMVSRGLRPHFDFFTHHNPLFFYIYSLPQHFFGPSLLAGRLLSLFFSLGVFVLVCLLSKRLGGTYAALLAGLFFSLNLFSTSYLVSYSYHALEGLFTALFFFFMTSAFHDKYKYFLCTFLLLLTIGTRYMVDITMVFLLLFAVYLYLQEGHSLKALRGELILGFGMLALFTFPYLPVFERWAYQCIKYPLVGTAGAKGAMLNTEGFMSLIFFRLNILKKLLDNFLPVLIGVFSLGAGMIWLGLTDKERLVRFWKENTVLSMMVVFVVLSELYYQIPMNSWPVTRLYYFPVACVVAGVFWQKLASFSARSLFGPVVTALPVVLICLSVFVQERPNIRATWETAHLNYLGRISRYLRTNTPPDAELFTFDPPFVIEADRKLSLNMLMETWQIFPEMPTEECRKYGLVNVDMIIEELRNKKPYALVLKNPGRLEDNGGKGRILIPYRETIWEAIHRNYVLAHTIPMKKGVDGVVDIYFRKT